ncbi:MAG: Panacea domain-containing protein [Dokdonella sp.]
MIVSHERDKLIQVIVFFARNTKYCGKIKLIKLLYLLDFEHFRQTGRSVTGMDYRAWKMGPVPFGFYQEFDRQEPDLAAAIDIVPEKVIDYTRAQVVSKIAFDDSRFTRRELNIMEQLAKRFRDSKSQSMIDVTHEERGPWETIWDDGRGNNERIPYPLAVPTQDPHRDAILASAREYAEIQAAQMH